MSQRENYFLMDDVNTLKEVEKACLAIQTNCKKSGIK
jgi:hypothetical protein